MLQRVDFEGYKEKLTYVRSNVENLINHKTIKDHPDIFGVENIIEDVTTKLTKVISTIMFLENDLNVKGKGRVYFQKFIDSEIYQISGGLFTLQKKLTINFEYLRDILFKINVDIARATNRYKGS